MHLITSLLLFVFCILYLGQDSKNKTIKDIAEYLNDNSVAIGHWGFIYGSIATILSLFFVLGRVHVGIIVLANILLVILSARYAHKSIKKHIKNKDSKLHEIIDSMVRLTDKHGTILASVGGIIGLICILNLGV